MSVDRGFTWMDDETLALIDIYSKDEVQQELNSSKRNISVYEGIANDLLDAGYRRTAYQCREKIKRLRKEYHLAKYCIEHDIVSKKPMKYFELVDKIFNRDNTEPSSTIDFGLLSSDLEDELHFTFTQDQESDASNSCCSGIESAIPQVILPGPSCSPIPEHESTSISSLINSQNSPSNTHTDSNDAFLLNGDQAYNCSNSPLEDSESLWVPNVVLVENDLGHSDLENCTENPRVFSDMFHENGSLHNFQDKHSEETAFADTEEPPEKKRKFELTQNFFNKMLEKVTETFLKYHEMTESRFLERVSHLEQERMKRDENLQKLWMEFEERRRKEEQQHELRMMSLLGQFIRQIGHSESSST